jgi:hypothetical protein
MSGQKTLPILKKTKKTDTDKMQKKVQTQVLMFRGLTYSCEKAVSAAGSRTGIPKKTPLFYKGLQGSATMRNSTCTSNTPEIPTKGLLVFLLRTVL